MDSNFKGSKDQRINRPPKAAAKGSTGRQRRRPKDQPAAEGGSQRNNRSPKAGQRINRPRQRINLLAMVKGSMIRPHGRGAYHYIMAYHHRIQITSSWAGDTWQKYQKIFLKIQFSFALKRSKMRFFEKLLFFQRINLTIQFWDFLEKKNNNVWDPHDSYADWLAFRR